MQLPFESEYPPEVFKKARSGHFEFTEDFEDVSEEAKSLIQSLLNVARRKQPTVQTVMWHKCIEPLNDFESFDETYEVLDDGALTGAPSVFDSYNEYACTDGIRRFRSVAAATRMMVKLSSKVMNGRRPRTRKQRVERGFQFNVSGINIALIHKSTSSDGVYGEIRITFQ